MIIDPRCYKLKNNITIYGKPIRPKAKKRHSTYLIYNSCEECEGFYGCSETVKQPKIREKIRRLIEKKPEWLNSLSGPNREDVVKRFLS
jgi:hypothetical protein